MSLTIWYRDNTTLTPAIHREVMETDSFSEAVQRFTEIRPHSEIISIAETGNKVSGFTDEEIYEILFTDTRDPRFFADNKSFYRDQFHHVLDVEEWNNTKSGTIYDDTRKYITKVTRRLAEVVVPDMMAYPVYFEDKNTGEVKFYDLFTVGVMDVDRDIQKTRFMDAREIEMTDYARDIDGTAHAVAIARHVLKIIEDMRQG